MKPKKPTMKQVAEHIYKTDVLISHIMLKLRDLEEKSHEPRDFVCCKECGCKLKKDE
tara:strand:+ start:4267 stop:4437 length:171 start_codon:yes stop_codon:yes gene_type:complete